MWVCATGGVRVDRAQYARTTGHPLELLPGSSIDADGPEDVYGKVFHTVVQSHLHRLVRALGLHYNGAGWAIIREHVARSVPVCFSDRALEGLGLCAADATPTHASGSCRTRRAGRAGWRRRSSTNAYSRCVWPTTLTTYVWALVLGRPLVAVADHGVGGWGAHKPRRTIWPRCPTCF
jgi:hypothetical protein